MSIDRAIEYALADEAAFEPSTLTRPGTFDDQALRLTSREREIAALIARGRTNHQIADELVVSARTVEWHVGNILAKLGLQARGQIAVWAAERGRATST